MKKLTMAVLCMMTAAMTFAAQCEAGSGGLVGRIVRGNGNEGKFVPRRGKQDTKSGKRGKYTLWYVSLRS